MAWVFCRMTKKPNYGSATLLKQKMIALNAPWVRFSWNKGELAKPPPGTKAQQKLEINTHKAGFSLPQKAR